MREILFRGKRTDNSEWVRGYYVAANYSWHKRGVHRDWIVSAACANGGWFSIHGRYPIVTDTVGQYTGFTDKNGTKIFEGDILSAHFDFNNPDVESRTVVEWGNYRWVTHQPGYEPDDITDFDKGLWTVIGNIHDNPELLNGEES